ncbi:MAG: hypothetical protein P4L51_02790 [Puia sp.]|nr:hypothetical protein [Puia sp.]
MKKANTLFAFLLLLAGLSAKAQTYQAGTNTVSAGIGLGSSIAGYTYGSQSPGISLQYERGIWEAGPGVISLGGYLGFKSYRYSASDGYGDNYSEKWNYTIVGARGAYHYTGFKVENLDVYGGLMLSYNHLSYSASASNGSGSYGASGGSYGSAVGFTAFVGGRYYFANSLGAFAELGYGVSYLNVGLAYKF